MTEWIEKLRQWMAESDNMVFFGGAGVSTESGIPDFRSVDGLYHQKFQYPPETILSHSFYVRHKAEFYDFYRAKMLAPWAQPNAAHRKLAQWEQEGKLKAVITQNIDGLHQKAGSKKVYELHGSVLRNYCTRCGKFYSAEFVKNQIIGPIEITTIKARKRYFKIPQTTRTPTGCFFTEPSCIGIGMSFSFLAMFLYLLHFLFLVK